MRAREKYKRLALFPTLIQESTKVTRALQRWNNKVTQRKWTALTGRGRRPVLMNHSRAHSKSSPPCFDNWRAISLPNFCSETSTHTHQAKVSTAMHIENEERESCKQFTNKTRFSVAFKPHWWAWIMLHKATEKSGSVCSDLAPYQWTVWRLHDPKTQPDLYLAATPTTHDKQWE